MGSIRPCRLRVLLLFIVLLTLAIRSLAQTTISTGSIQGTVLDPTNAAVAGAKVQIGQKSTGWQSTTTTNEAGTYVSGALIPGNYTVHVEAKGFKTVDLLLQVQVGVTTPGSLRLQVGQTSQVVEVHAGDVTVQTEQATVQGVLTAEQIDTLPVNGRNFLDLAQLEPGVQIQDGANFDPTKNGFSSVSFGGRFGRSARIEVDGLDISDETVGTTTQNVPQGAIQEFQLGQSMLDLSTELTSSGSVNVVTRSGTNNWHGNAFYNFRDNDVSASLPGGTDSPFQRNQFGGRVGGPIMKDRLFFFLDAERTKQDLTNPVNLKNQFQSLTGDFDSPFRDSEILAKLDYQFKNTARLFYRFSWEQNNSIATFLPNTYQPFASSNHAPVNAFGLDFTTGVYTHSIRVGFTEFRNRIADALTSSDIFNPAPLLELAIGSDPKCQRAGEDLFCSGPNLLAPQATYQSDKQFKYDGSRAWGAHVVRYGFQYNYIQGGGFAKFLDIAPAVSSASDISLATGPFPGGATNPLNYPAQQVLLGNGQGFSSDKSAFGLPGGGLGPDNRIAWYIGDTWKLRPNFTLMGGLRYVRDTGRTDSDIAPIPCSELDPTLAANLALGGTPCNKYILNLWGPGLADRVRQPNSNFAPQLGFAWDPKGHGKTVIRGGIGLFYENALWNNSLFDRPPRSPQGLFLGQTTACNNGTPVPVVFPDGSVVDPTFCNEPIGSVEEDIAALQRQYQAAVAAGSGANLGFIGNTLASGINATGTSMLAPNYQTPRSVQMNLGIQKELRRGMVLSADYVRNVATHTLQAVDTNHVGDARFLDVDAALSAITATATPFGCPAATSAGGGPNGSITVVSCYLAAKPGASISDLAANGLDSGDVLCGGAPCPAAAFPGINKNLGTNQMLFPNGRSVYSGVQISFKQNMDTTLRGIKHMNLQVSYAYSKYQATSNDSDFVNFAEDNNNPDGFIGPNGLDRRHQLSFGGTLNLPARFTLGLIGHFYSPLPLDLRLPTSGESGGIFVTDVTGDGTGDGSVVSNGGVGDLVPGTQLGAFGRTVSAGDINQLIASYNLNDSGKPTPAGQALLTASLFTQTQLAALGGVQQPIQAPPTGQVGMGWLHTLDVSLGWTYNIKEGITIEPNITFFNLPNFSNFDSPSSHMSGILDGTAGSANGTTAGIRHEGNTRSGLGSGVFGLGAPRQLQFGLRLTF